MEAEDWDCHSSEDELLNARDNHNEDEDELQYSSSLLSKLQLRSDVSKARWNEEMSMAEVVEKRGKMWVTTGIVRNGKTCCFIEETVFLVEQGALSLINNNDATLSLQDIYAKLVEEKTGCCWELFEVYRHLKSLGYIVGRHGVPWSLKGVKNNEGTNTEPNDVPHIIEMLDNLQLHHLRPVFDVYNPNSKFKKSLPGDPAFLLCPIRGNPPSTVDIESLESRHRGIPIKLCHVEHGRVCFFSFEKVELPVLP